MEEMHDRLYIQMMLVSMQRVVVMGTSGWLNLLLKDKEFCRCVSMEGGVLSVMMDSIIMLQV